MFWHDGMGMVGWWGLGLGMLLFWGVVIGGIVLLVRWAVGTRAPQGGAAAPPPRPADEHAAPGPDAHRILDERFARGEIDEEEYRHRRQVLRGG